MLKGLSDGDFINMISAAVFAILIAAITVRFVLEPPAGGGVALDNRSRRSSIPYNSQQQQTSSSSGSYEMRTSRKLANPDEDEDNMLVNFNNGNSPFGLKANAEIWNGRIAMVRTKTGWSRAPKHPRTLILISQFCLRVCDLSSNHLFAFVNSFRLCG